MVVLISSSLKNLTNTDWWLQTANWIQNLLQKTNKQKKPDPCWRLPGRAIQSSLRLLLHLSSSFDTNLNEKVKQRTCLKSTGELEGCKSLPKTWNPSPRDRLCKEKVGSQYFSETFCSFWLSDPSSIRIPLGEASIKYSVLYNLNHFTIKLRMMSQDDMKSVFLAYLQGYVPVICLQINLFTFLSDPEY